MCISAWSAAASPLKAMQILAADLGVAPYVTFTGRVPDEQMLEMLNTADVCVNPDIANEMNDKSTMNKVMEYMALGKPIVQFDLTEGRFSAQQSSLYARPNDALDLGDQLIDLLDDPQRREQMGRDSVASGCSTNCNGATKRRN